MTQIQTVCIKKKDDFLPDLRTDVLEMNRSSNYFDENIQIFG